MKKRNFTVVLICIFSVLSLVFSSSAYSSDEEMSWYIKRNGTSQPKIQKNQEIIYNYNGYFIDKKVDDNSTKKIIYLTFDLGYSNENVEKIINTLNEKNVPAAFFILDNIILKNCDLVTKMSSGGHLICNHTRNHKNLTRLCEEEIKENIISLETLYKEKTGNEMAKYFRFPEGKYSEKALKVVDSLGYKTIFWSFAYADWDNSKQPSEAFAMKKILDNVHNGAVMLFHPTSKTNASIFPNLIDNLRELGYEFGTLDQLVCES